MRHYDNYPNIPVDPNKTMFDSLVDMIYEAGSTKQYVKIRSLFQTAFQMYLDERLYESETNIINLYKLVARAVEWYKYNKYKSSDRTKVPNPGLTVEEVREDIASVLIQFHSVYYTGNRPAPYNQDSFTVFLDKMRILRTVATEEAYLLSLLILQRLREHSQRKSEYLLTKCPSSKLRCILEQEQEQAPKPTDSVSPPSVRPPVERAFSYSCSNVILNVYLVLQTCVIFYLMLSTANLNLNLNTP